MMQICTYQEIRSTTTTAILRITPKDNEALYEASSASPSASAGDRPCYSDVLCRTFWLCQIPDPIPPCHWQYYRWAKNTRKRRTQCDIPMRLRIEEGATPRWPMNIRLLKNRKTKYLGCRQAWVCSSSPQGHVVQTHWQLHQYNHYCYLSQYYPRISVLCTVPWFAEAAQQGMYHTVDCSWRHQPAPQ